MGLAMVYGIVKNHGGAIEVESSVGQGTTFHLFFPHASRTDAETETRPPSGPVLGTGKILLVDDEEMVRNIGARLLHYLGYEVVVAADGAEALEMYRQQQSQVELVVLDMIMPNMSGRECFHALRSINPQVKVVLATGYDQNHAAQEIMDEGAQGFVQKPYDLHEFSTCIGGALNKSIQPGSLRETTPSLSEGSCNV